MLALLGLLTLVALLAAILSKRVSPPVALIVIPVAAALAGGFGLETGKFMVRGLRDVAPGDNVLCYAETAFFGSSSDLK